MAFSVKYRVTVKSNVGNTITTTEIEILEDGFAGDVTELEGWAQSGVFKHEYEEIDPRKPFDDPVQKARLELHFAVRNSSHKAILTEIFNAAPKTLKMRKKIDSSVEWTGWVKTGGLSYPEKPYPYKGTIIAKDITEGPDYTLATGRETIITTFASLLSSYNLGLDINTYTGWTEDSILNSDDFFNLIYQDKENIREFGRDGEDDRTLSNFDVLKKLCQNYKVILRQAGGAWKLYQLSALSDGTSVDEFVYNSSGVQQSSGSVNLVTNIDKSSRYVVPVSRNLFTEGIKKTKVLFRHRSAINGIQIPSLFKITGTGTQSFTQFFLSDGTQQFGFSVGIAGLVIGGSTDDARIGWRFRGEKSTGGFYDWDADAQSWSEDSGVLNYEDDFSLYDDGDGNTLYAAIISMSTVQAPPDMDGDITLTFHNGERTPSTTEFDETKFMLNSQFRIVNDAIEEGGSVAIEYELEQSADHDRRYVESEGSWFGDGPTDSALSRLTTDVDGDNLTDAWKVRGEASTVPFFHLHSREVMDAFRNSRRILRAIIRGPYSPANMVGYDSEEFFFLNGEHTGYENTWNCDILNINIETASDTFTTFYLTSTDSEGGTSSGSSGGGGGGGGGISEPIADSRYVNVDGDVMEGDLDLGGFDLIDVGDIDAANLELSGTLDINGQTVIDSSRNASFVGGTFTGEVDVRAGINFSASSGLSSTISPNIVQNSNNLWIQGGGDLVGILKSNGFSTPFFYDEPNTLFAFIEPVVIGGSALSGSETLRVAGDIRAEGDVSIVGTTPQTLYTETDQSNKQWHTEVNDGHYRIVETGVKFHAVFNDGGSTEFFQPLQTDNFSSGILGSGWKLDYDTGSGTFFEIDNMRVRNELRTHIFKKDVVKAANGYTLFTDSAVSTESTTFTTSVSDTIDLKNTEGNATFSTDDMLWIKSISDDGTTISGIQLTVTGSTNNGDYTTYNVDVNNGGSLNEGDVAVRVSGGYLLADASSEFSPFLDVYNEVDTWSDFQSFDKLKGRYGNLEGITSATFGQLQGHGLWTNNIYAEGNVQVAGTLTAGDANGVGSTFYAGRMQKNRISHSEDHSVYGTRDATKTINTGEVTDPSGGNGATKLVPTAGATDSAFGRESNSTYSISIDYTTTQTVLSLWIRSVSGSFDVNIGGNAAVYKTVTVTEEWQRFYTIIDDGGTDVHIIGGWSEWVEGEDLYVWGIQIEEGDHPTAYQPTGDAILSSDDGFGMWARAGGFGGTIQNPVWKITDQYLTNNDVYIGNDLESVSAVGNLLIGNYRDGVDPIIRIVSPNNAQGFAQIGYDSPTGEWGIRGDQESDGATIFQLGSTNQIAGWEFNSTQLFHADATNTNSIYLDSAQGAITVYRHGDGFRASMGRMWLSGGWTDEYGFALAASNGASPYVQFTRNITTDALTARIAGSYFDATDMWGGNASKGSASVRLDFANGDVYYDGMSRTVYSYSSEASTSNNAEANTSTGVYETSATSTGAGVTVSKRKVYTKYTHRRNENILKVTGSHRRAQNIVSGSIESAEVSTRLHINGSEVDRAAATLSGSLIDFELDADISGLGLTPGELYDLEIYLAVFVDASSGGSVDMQGFLSRDINVTTATGN